MVDFQTLGKIGIGVASVATAAATAYYVTSGPSPLDVGVDVNNQSKVLEVNIQ